MPATESNAELCKGLLSALVLGYPTPTLINWQKRFTSQTLSFNGSHIGKITGTLDFINKLGEEKLDQLMLLVDGYDLWFQLPPSVLHSRFRSVGRQLFNLTETKVGRKTVEKARISQSIIFSAEKDCGPGAGQVDEVACYGQPDSPLRPDLYGDDTDVRDPKTHLPLHKRPSFLCSGFIAGPIRNMKALMERAKQKADEKEAMHGGSDQRVFNEIFGEQEYWREMQRQHHRSIFRKAADAVEGILGMSGALITDAHASHRPANVTDAYGPYEFGIGLDYGLELVQSMVFSEFDGRFLTYNQEQATNDVLSGAGMPSPPRVHGLPKDVIDDDGGFKWGEQPLYTNVWTGSIPLAVHLNGIKNMRQGIWDQMWFYPTAKVQLQLKKNKVAQDTDGRALSWTDICQQYEAEIFSMPK